jgi:mannose-6-phosphate isomerase-like protein (cupin superfamily)
MTAEPLVRRESDVDVDEWADPVRGHVGFRTLVGDGRTATSALTAGVSELGPGGWLGHHRHEPAEVYYILEGVGVVSIDGQEHAVEAGTVVFVPSDAEHGISNTGPAGLRFFYVFAADSFTEVAYRFTAESPGDRSPNRD